MTEPRVVEGLITPGSTVRFKQSDVRGVVGSVIVTPLAYCYCVIYWNGTQRNEATVSAFEIEAVDGKPLRIGFAQ